MYGLSWTCVPVWITPIASYYCAIGLGLLLTGSVRPTLARLDFHMQAGYMGHLSLMGNSPAWLLGINAVALAQVLWLACYMRAAGIGLWPWRKG